MQGTSQVSVHHSFPAILDVDDGESERSIFGYEVGLFPVIDKQELSATASLSPHLHRSAQPSHPDWEHDQSASSHCRLEGLRYGSPLHLQEEGEFREYQQQQKVVGAIEENDNENDMDLQPAKRQKLSSLFTDNSPTPTYEHSPRHRFKQDHIPTPSSTTQSEVTELQPLGLNGNSPTPIDNDHCYSPRSPRSPSLIEPAPAAEYQE
ncbi:hypothetical protein SBOR_9207 [Sclerotinia borealis F-4128]|uniref:Uncharacterized protein n=1 Tax=Sclerotinia borealis (strain F-4128) TaxID=1432307 RepID=W9C6A0_SCLBF|nr:hypothetical protein SBOR_9207 [Sclerotinia borealis F-4128]